MTVNSILLQFLNRSLERGRMNFVGEKRNAAASKGTGATIKRSKCLSLPNGWIRQVTFPPKNSELKKKKISYIGPDGQICRTKQALENALGNQGKLANFNFQKGSFVEKPKLPKPNFDPANYKVKRFIPCTFSGPVTAYRTHNSETETKEDPEQNSSFEKPAQLLWSRRLMGLKPAYLPDNTIADIKEKIAKIMEPSSICQREEHITLPDLKIKAGVKRKKRRN